LRCQPISSRRRGLDQDKDGQRHLQSPRRAIELKDNEAFLGKKYADAPEVDEEASPITHVSKQSPPTILLQGTIDAVVPLSQSANLAKALDAKGVPYVYVPFEGQFHAFDYFNDTTERSLYFTKSFLAEYVGQLLRLKPNSRDMAEGLRTEGRICRAHDGAGAERRLPHGLRPSLPGRRATGASRRGWCAWRSKRAMIRARPRVRIPSKAVKGGDRSLCPELLPTLTASGPSAADN
jgi:Prolyl oligopeptidase family